MMNEDIISMPDKWEYPGTRPGTLPSTRSALHRRPRFAKEQMKLMLKGVYLHPSGQMPAYDGTSVM